MAAPRRFESDSPEPQLPDTLPRWIQDLAVPLWVVDTRFRIRYLNEEARTVLGISPGETCQRRCYEVVAARDVEDHTFCNSRCAVLAALRAGRRIRPILLQVSPRRGRRRWMLILPIPVEYEFGVPTLVAACALDIDEYYSLKRYFVNVASRATDEAGASSAARLGELTARQTEVLRQLACGASPKSVARKLHISYPTVRNHIQHTLERLDVHSIQEAVALYLLREGNETRARP